VSIDLKTAQSIIERTIANGRDHSFKPLTVVVLDTGGHVIAVAREDGASNNRFEIAYGKAHGSLALGMGSRALAARAEQQPTFISAVNSMLGGKLIPVPGGVLVRDAGGVLVGAVGVTGDTSDNDEIAAVAGVESAGFVAQCVDVN
jgi:uncharacterized protein GlcG (DUF336 family)